MFTKKQVDLFWSHVDKSGDCWNWTARHTRDGYGAIHWGRKAYSAHRVAYTIATNDYPDGFCIMHTCDNKSCCNPSHLIKGTHLDNMRDMIRKGRQAKSFPPYKRKMTMELAEQLRKDFLVCKNKHELSRKYGICPRHVRGILRGEHFQASGKDE